MVSATAGAPHVATRMLALVGAGTCLWSPAAHGAGRTAMPAVAGNRPTASPTEEAGAGLTPGLAAIGSPAAVGEGLAASRSVAAAPVSGLDQPVVPHC